MTRRLPEHEHTDRQWRIHEIAPGAKGLNLAVSDVRELTAALGQHYRAGASELLDNYSAVAAVIVGARSAAEIAQTAAMFAHPVPVGLWDELARI